MKTLDKNTEHLYFSREKMNVTDTYKKHLLLSKELRKLPSYSCKRIDKNRITVLLSNNYRLMLSGLQLHITYNSELIKSIDCTCMPVYFDFLFTLCEFTSIRGKSFEVPKHKRQKKVKPITVPELKGSRIISYDTEGPVYKCYS